MKHCVNIFKDLYIFNHYGVRTVPHNFGLLEERLWHIMMFFAHERLLSAKDHTMSLQTLAHYVAIKNHDLLISKLNGMKEEVDMSPPGRYFEAITIIGDVVVYQYPLHLRVLFSNKFELDFLKKVIPLKFESRYSIFLYRLAYMYNLLRYVKIIPVCSLRRFLDIQPHQYADPKYFFQKVLIKAMYEINEKTDLIVNLKPIKEGKGIVAFFVNVKCKPDIEPDNSSVEELSNFVAQNVAFFKAFYMGKDYSKFFEADSYCVDSYISCQDRKIITQLILDARKPNQLDVQDIIKDNFKPVRALSAKCKNCMLEE